MMKLHSKPSLILTTLVTSWVTSGAIAAEPAAAVEQTDQQTARWELLAPASDGTVELVARNAAGAIAAVCREGQCGVFVEPLAGCVPGSRYPLLVNSAKQVGVIASTCGVLSTNGAQRYVVRLDPQNALFPAMLNGDDVSIAFPTQAGQMNVINVSMDGVREHLAKLLPQGDGDASEAAAATPESEAAAPKPADPVNPPAPQAQAPANGDAPSSSQAAPEPNAPAANPFTVPERNHFGGAMTSTGFRI